MTKDELPSNEDSNAFMQCIVSYLIEQLDYRHR